MLGGSFGNTVRATSPLRAFLPIAAAASLVVPAAAHADQSAGPSGASAVEQYVEQVPTARGPSAPGVSSPTTRRLTPKERAALAGTSPAVAAALTRVATSSAYGAPKAAQVAGSVPSGAASANDSRLVGLLIVLIATTVGALMLAARRGRS